MIQSVDFAHFCWMNGFFRNGPRRIRVPTKTELNRSVPFLRVFAILTTFSEPNPNRDAIDVGPQKMNVKFIHAADLHLDSPLKGLGTTDSVVSQKIRETSRKAFQNLVDYAILENVRFITIAGDLVDGRWEDTATGLWALRQFKRLNERGIPVFVVFGNHDLQNRMIRSVPWPENVKIFSASRPETVLLESERVAIHGQSYSACECRTDLASQYPPAIDGYFNLGLLHSSLAGETSDDPYAPTSTARLNEKNYQYWALGHAHQSQVLQESPSWIGYSGVLQGRHIRETGAKGFFVAEIDNRRLSRSPKFVDCDVLRWFLLDWDVSRLEESSSSPTQWEEAFLIAFVERLREIRAAANGRFAAVRVVLKGRTPLHRKTFSLEAQNELTEKIETASHIFEDSVWLEEIQWKTSIPIDGAAVRSSGLFGDLVQEIESRIRFFDEKSTSSVLDSASPLVRRQESIWLQDLRRRLGSTLFEAELDLDDPLLMQECYKQVREFLLDSFR